MRRVRRLSALVASTTLAAALSAAGQTPTPTPPAFAIRPAPAESGLWSFSASGFSLGVNSLSGREREDSKFEEFREVPDGPFLEALRLVFEKEGGGPTFDLRAVDVGQQDESYRLFARAGRVSGTAFFDRTPHLLTKNAASLLEPVRRGELRISDAVQSVFEGLDTTSGPPNVVDNPAIPPLAQNLVDSLDRRRLGYERKEGGLALDLSFTDRWAGHVTWSRESRSGSGVTAAGSYERQALGGSGPAHTGDFFRVLDLEMPEPVDFVTTRIGASTDFAGPNWTVDARVDFSRFENDVDFLVFDNPLRITPFASSAFRQRFAQGIHVLPPDNQTAEVTLSGAVRLPLASRLQAALSIAEWRQDDTLGPYTLNSAISAQAGFDVTSPANLPVPDLDGKIRVSTANLLFTTTPLDPLSVTLRYRVYDSDNRSREIVFPGYAAFSESAWRTNIEGNPIVNRVQDFRRTRYGAEAVYRVVPAVALEVLYEREEWDRSRRTVEKSDEDAVGGAVRFRPSSAFSARIAYHHAKRDIGEYHPELEFAELRDFDVAASERNVGNALVQWSPSPRWSFGANVSATLDDYNESSYGRLKDERWGGGLDATFAASEALQATAFWARETLDQFMRNNAKDDRIGGTFFLPVNDWTDELQEQVDAFGVALYGSAGERWRYEVRYSATLGRSSFSARNPNGPPKLTNAQAFPWPDIESDLSSVRLDLTYNLTKSLSVGARYWYEDFRLDDFTMDIVEPYMFDRTIGTRTDTRRAFYLDATYGDYSINVGTAYVRYVF